MNSRTRVIPALVAAVGVLALIAAVGASGRNGDDDDEGGGDVFRTSVIAAASGDSIHGVTAAADWRLRRGSVRIKSDDDELELRVELRGLVLRSTGRPGVEAVRAALFCGGARADTTRSARLSRRGDARIRDEVDAPRRCLAPTVLVQPNGNAGVFVAATGFVD